VATSTTFKLAGENITKYSRYWYRRGQRILDSCFLLSLPEPDIVDVKDKVFNKAGHIHVLLQVLHCSTAKSIYQYLTELFSISKINNLKKKNPVHNYLLKTSQTN
jgi:hypothetical protein